MSESSLWLKEIDDRLFFFRRERDFCNPIFYLIQRPIARVNSKPAEENSIIGLGSPAPVTWRYDIDEFRALYFVGLFDFLHEIFPVTR